MGPPRPRVVRGWEPPPSPYGRGHRGVDLAAPPGTGVRAAAGGRIVFAGRVAGRGVLTIALGGPAGGTERPPPRLTHEPVTALLPAGTAVRAGQRVGVTEAGGSHCAAGCLHWGLIRDGVYANPLILLRPAPSRLLPLTSAPPAAGAGTDPLRRRHRGRGGGGGRGTPAARGHAPPPRS
ncbi:M23 family metallopeptidase [Streptomyces sp. CAU 1734]|uniref:M23 family metallopeptidase n=1 Tax=Streptomyces sp. CAU 1734 TaxID=3140360 RepID=UPI003260C822